MKSPRGLYALIAVLLFVCAAVAWEWYAHVSGNQAAPRPVQQIPAPTPSGVATATPTPVTYVPVPPAASASPAGPAPVESATVAPQVVAARPIVAPPDAPPRIISMSLNTPVARAGDIVSGTVETSTNVASVEARIAGYSSSMRKVGAGKFSLSYRVPYLPFFLHRTYQIEVIARNTKGLAVRTAVPITIR